MTDKNFVSQLIAANPDAVDFGDFGEGVSEEWLFKAQERLKVTFPPSYVWWLKNYGGGSIYGDEIFSVYEMDFDNVVGGDIVYMNELDRKNGLITEQQLALQSTDYGNYFYFDLQQVNDHEESPVYDQLNGLKYADDFLHFLAKQIRSIYY